jgi:chemotaxis methyl-accepting protein methylase
MRSEELILGKLQKMISKDLYVLICKQLKVSDESHKEYLLDALDEFVRIENANGLKILLIKLVANLSNKTKTFINELVTAETKYSLNKCKYE